MIHCMMMHYVIIYNYCNFKSKAGISVEIFRYKNLPHGLLSLAMPTGLKESYHCVNLNINIINQELNS